MDKDVKRVIDDIPTLDDKRLDEIGRIYYSIHKTYLKEFGRNHEKTHQAKQILDALIDESWKREARATYNKLPDTYNELMTMILEGEENIHGLSKEKINSLNY